MIPRYEKKEISQIWGLTNKYQTFLKVELAVLKAMEGKLVPENISQNFIDAKIDVERINEIEKETKHDVIAFCTSITEQYSAESSRFFHFGVTSSDVIDTATTLQIKQSLDFIIPAMEKLLSNLKKRAVETKDWACMGRSHGMNAEPMSFGQKWLSLYAEFKRRLTDIKAFYETELTAQFSGAVGNYTIISPEIEEQAAKNLGLHPEPISTQVIPRDRMAKLICINALIAAAIERASVEIRHLHHSDIGELHEGFSKGQKGSSIMPHKKNPISGENLTGIARVLKSHVSIALENNALWHERDISHSSAERLMLPDNLGLLLYAVERLDSTVENLVFHKEIIENKTQKNLGYLSSFYLHFLIKNTDKTREELYKIIQAAAFQQSEGDTAENFHKRIIENANKQGVDAGIFNSLDIPSVQSVYLGHVNKVFNRSLD